MNYLEMYVHLVWATWERLPLLAGDVEVRVHGAILKKCHDMKCKPLAIGGVADHVHVLAVLHPTVAVANLVQEAKGASLHLATHQVSRDAIFKWQGGYGAFTLRKSDIPQVSAYIRNQKQHHASNNIVPDYERISSE